MKVNHLIHVIFSIFLILVMATCQSPTADKKMNVLLICVDDLRPELKSFGAEYIISPNIDHFAQQGFSFKKHFVNAPSCGPSRYTLLTGLYGTRRNDALFKRAENIADGQSVNPSMPEWFKNNGFTTVSVGKVSHHPGGRGGENWDDENTIEMPNAWDRHLMPVGDWQHPRGMMHGLANGEIRVKPHDMAVYQSIAGEDDIYPDGLISNEAVSQLKILSEDSENPFFLAVGIIRPHLPFGAPKAYLENYEGVQLPAIKHPEKPKGQSTWHGSGEFRNYDLGGKDPNIDSEFADELRRHYAACVSYADAQVGKILAELKRTGADKNTIVVLWGDHGWHLGEHAIWGKHSLFEESLHSPLVINYPGIERKGGETQAMVETLDIFPTLCDLSGIDMPDFTQGSSLKKIIDNPTAIGHPSIAYWGKAKTIRTDTHRMILHQDGFVELYDHTSVDGETRNIAEGQEALIAELTKTLNTRLLKVDLN